MRQQKQATKGNEHKPIHAFAANTDETARTSHKLKEDQDLIKLREIYEIW